MKSVYSKFQKKEYPQPPLSLHEWGKCSNNGGSKGQKLCNEHDTTTTP